MFTKTGKERGYPPVSRSGFDDQNRPKGALLVGNPEEVAQKIIHHSQAPGGISRFTLQMDTGLPHEKLLKCIELIGRKVLLIVNS